LLYSRDRGETLTVLCAVAVNAEIEDEEEDGALKYVRLGAFTPLIVTHDGHVLVGASTRRRCYLQERVRRSSAQSVSGEQATGSCSAQRSGPRLEIRDHKDPAVCGGLCGVRPRSATCPAARHRRRRCGDARDARHGTCWSRRGDPTPYPFNAYARRTLTCASTNR